MRLNRAVFPIILLLLVSALSGAAQDVENEGIFQTALALTAQNCSGLRRNEACYGHALLTAAPYPGVKDFQFDREGDIVRLTDMQSIKLSGLNADTGTWGVALFHLRANLPSSQPENVTMVAFGDVELTNAVKVPTHARVQARTRENVNVRYYPSLEARVIGTLQTNQTVMALERVADSSWLRVQLPDSDETGWVFAELMNLIDDVSTLNISESPTTYYEPMQAFYFRSGSDEPEMNTVPQSGLLIQTPEGVGEVQLLINEINIQLGSTVFFQADANGVMTISTIEGHADIIVNGVAQTAFDGTSVTVPLNNNLEPSGTPALPQPYNENEMKRLPLDTLKRRVSVHTPRTELEIIQLIEEQAATEAARENTATADVPPTEGAIEVTTEVTPLAETTAEVTLVVPTQAPTADITPAPPNESGGGSESTPEPSPPDSGGDDTITFIDPTEEGTAEPAGG